MTTRLSTATLANGRDCFPDCLVRERITTLDRSSDSDQPLPNDPYVARNRLEPYLVRRKRVAFHGLNVTRRPRATK